MAIDDPISESRGMPHTPSNGRPIRRPGFWARRLTDVYTVGAGGVARAGSWWWKRSQRWTDEGIQERWADTLPPDPPPNPIWIHSASMGEVRVGAYFAEVIEKRDVPIIASAMTETGFRLCRDVYPLGTVAFRVPFDLPKPMRKAFAHFNPRALILVETEWWPNFLIQAAECEVPVFIINGRLSEKAYHRYRMGAVYWRSILRAVQFFFMRTQEEADRVLALGVDPWRVRVGGSLKVPSLTHSLGIVEKSAAGASDASHPVWLAGCTRRGEDDIILETFAGLREEFPKLQLWIAPRHPKRFDKVSRLIRRAGFEATNWSDIARGDSGRPENPVVLIDQMGILAQLYSEATVAFVGGSLLPFGGHNPLEPALVGAPVVFGPHMEDQRDAAELLLGMGTAMQVQTFEALRGAVATSLRAPVKPELRRQRAKELRSRLLGIRDEVADDLFAILDALDTPAAASTPGGGGD